MEMFKYIQWFLNEEHRIPKILLFTSKPGFSTKSWFLGLLESKLDESVIIRVIS